MNQLIWLVIIFLVFYWVSIILVIFFAFRKSIMFFFKYRLTREKLVRGIFMMPNGFLLDDQYILTDEYNMINYDGGSYQVEKKKGFYSTGRNILTMIYEYGNPCPINFKAMKKDNIPDYDSSGLQKALQEKFIKDLLAEQNKMFFLILICAANTLVSLAIAIKVYDLIKVAGGG